MSTGYTWSLTGSFVYCSIWLGGWENRPSRNALPTESTNRLAGLPSKSYIPDLLIRPPETNWKLRYGKVVHKLGYMVLLGDSWGWGWKLRPGILNWTSEPAGCLNMVGWKLSIEFKACPEWSAGAAPWFLRSAEEFAAERGWFGPVGCCLLTWPELDSLIASPISTWQCANWFMCRLLQDDGRMVALSLKPSTWASFHSNGRCKCGIKSYYCEA